MYSILFPICICNHFVKDGTLSGKWENAISGKQLDSVRKETHVVSVMIHRLATGLARVREQKDKRPLPHQIRRHRLTERYTQKVQATEERAFVEQEARFRAENFLQGKCTYPSCTFWHPSVFNYKSDSRCTCGDKCRGRHVVATQLGCASQGSYPRKGKLGG